jgi:ferredoxin--NADP+ reductase
MDVARILAKTVDELKVTDITDHALATLEASQVKDIYVVARRGPAQVKFTYAEVKEFGELADADPVVEAADMELDPLSAAEIAQDSAAQKNLEILREYSQRALTGKSRRVHFTFLGSPVEILDDGNGRVGAVRIERNMLAATESGYLNAVGTGETYTLPAGMILRSVGYKGSPLPGLPYDNRSGVIPNQEGRIVNPQTGTPRPGEYVVGWAKRGPTGIIGTNKPDAVLTVDRMWEDLPTLPRAINPEPAAVGRFLKERGVRYVTLADWKLIDALEIAAGASQNRPRVKMTRIADMLAALTNNVATRAR